MRNNKGFTLIEVVITISILIVIISIAIPSIITMNNRQKEKQYDRVVSTIEHAAITYFGQNPDTLLEDEYLMSLSELVNNNLIEDKIINPKTNTPFSKCETIKIEKDPTSKEITANFIDNSLYTWRDLPAPVNTCDEEVAIFTNENISYDTFLNPINESTTTSNMDNNTTFITANPLYTLLNTSNEVRTNKYNYYQYCVGDYVPYSYWDDCAYTNTDYSCVGDYIYDGYEDPCMYEEPYEYDCSGFCDWCANEGYEEGGNCSCTQTCTGYSCVSGWVDMSYWSDCAYTVPYDYCVGDYVNSSFWDDCAYYDQGEFIEESTPWGEPNNIGCGEYYSGCYDESRTIYNYEKKQKTTRNVTLDSNLSPIDKPLDSALEQSVLTKTIKFSELKTGYNQSTLVIKINGSIVSTGITKSSNEVVVVLSTPTKINDLEIYINYTDKLKLETKDANNKIQYVKNVSPGENVYAVKFNSINPVKKYKYKN